jgi:hypothetical protein
MGTFKKSEKCTQPLVLVWLMAEDLPLYSLDKNKSNRNKSKPAGPSEKPRHGLLHPLKVVQNFNHLPPVHHDDKVTKGNDLCTAH